MYYYDLFMQGPGVYIPVLLLSLLITMVGYGAFPIIFSKVRKKQITKRKFTLLCYTINLIVMIAFIAFGSKSSGAPYVLWTWIFSSVGLRNLEKRSKIGYKFKDSELLNEEIINEDDVRQSESINVENNDNNEYTVDVKIAEEKETDSMHIENGKTRKEKLTFCKLCGCKVDRETRKCEGCGKQYFRGFFSRARKLKNKYCKKCGNIINNQTKKCTNCGKQYLKGSHIITIILILIVVVLLYLVIALSIENNSNIDEWHYWKDKYDDIYEEYDFYHDHAVIVFDDDTKIYHRYNCSQWTSTVWIYNSEAAKSRGYSPCPKCFKKGSFNLNGAQN